MALNLPPNYSNDIQGRDTNLVPVVMIGNRGALSSTYHFISINW